MAFGDILNMLGLGKKPSLEREKIVFTDDLAGGATMGNLMQFDENLYREAMMAFRRRNGIAHTPEPVDVEFPKDMDMAYVNKLKSINEGLGQQALREFKRRKYLK